VSGQIILAGLLAGAAVFLALYQGVNWMAVRGASKVLVESDQADEGRSTAQALGAFVGQRVPQVMESIRRDLYWATTVEPKWRGLTPATVLGQMVLYSVGLMVLFWMGVGDPFFALVGLGAGYLLTVSPLHRKAEEVRRRIAQELPEFVQLMAAEAASGASLHTVVTRVAEGEGTVAAWFRNVLRRAHGRDLFGVNGYLLKAAHESGHPALISTAIQLNFAQASGTQVSALLKSLAWQAANDFIGEAEAKAEQLPNRLTIYGTLFYFAPFLIMIFVMIGVPLMQNMR